MLHILYISGLGCNKYETIPQQPKNGQSELLKISQRHHLLHFNILLYHPFLRAFQLSHPPNGGALSIGQPPNSAALSIGPPPNYF